MPGNVPPKAPHQCGPGDLKAAFVLLGWRTNLEAATVLGASSDSRVSDWRGGNRSIPPYIQAHLRTLLGIGFGDPWPRVPEQDHPLVLPKFMRGNLDEQLRENRGADPAVWLARRAARRR